ncbi:CLUMA_CG016443, isoform B [Clunio marinus]|uniref:CLUMA_CG016443, isoform B n=1 Tax=Clunio marinus TaxID=568069 RepID=A0A1J1IUM5_9DIPT|nr:CLUMA_CG016443, isoform B [Clunio marinus]
MRKKSPATIQKWVDSIAVDESDNSSNVKAFETIEEETCDSSSSELKTNQPSTSGTTENIKERLNDLCNKLNVNEKLKSKKIGLKNLIAKTTQKLVNESSSDPPMEQKNDENLTNEAVANIKDDNEEDSSKNEEIVSNVDNLSAPRTRIGVLGRSSSENPSPLSSRNRRLVEIGRSFSVANENELPPAQASSENLIYDADEDISITIPSLNTSPSIISNNTTNSLSNSQIAPVRANLLQARPMREHTVSEGHQSPQVQHKNPLLRDSSFQSDSSHCSSVESLLEARRPDAEAILVNLGFGPVHGNDDVLSKIPKRFLKPSQVRGVDTDTFLRNQHLSNHIHEHSVLGYRGLLGDSHVPSNIVKAIIERFSANEIRRMSSMESIDCSSPRTFKGIANHILAHRQFMK